MMVSKQAEQELANPKPPALPSANVEGDQHEELNSEDPDASVQAQALMPDNRRSTASVAVFAEENLEILDERGRQDKPSTSSSTCTAARETEVVTNKASNEAPSKKEGTASKRKRETPECREPGSTEQTPVKRARGRPKGSRTKKTASAQTLSDGGKIMYTVKGNERPKPRELT
ncbi:hypothetical protein AB1N83_005002 [Pleurotus pulmonarius]